jgi:transcriptional regulator with XRE-family HTH domain
MTGKRQYSYDELLSILREKKGEKTLSEFADEIGISYPMLTNILCGHRRVDGEAVLKYLGMRKVDTYERI